MGLVFVLEQHLSKQRDSYDNFLELSKKEGILFVVWKSVTTQGHHI